MNTVERIVDEVKQAAIDLGQARIAFTKAGKKWDAKSRARANALELTLKAAMRRAGLQIVTIDGWAYVDHFADHVADEDGDGLWDIAVIPANAISHYRVGPKSKPEPETLPEPEPAPRRRKTVVHTIIRTRRPAAVFA